MSQQKDSDQGANLEKPDSEPVTETNPESGSETGSAAATSGETAAEPTVVIDEKPTVVIDEKPTVKVSKPDKAATEPVSEGFDLHRVVTLGSIALLAIAAVAAAWFGGTWIIGGLIQDKPRADAREAALAGAQQAAINITSMNIDDVDGSLKLARSSMTGDLLDASTKNAEQIKKTVLESNVNMSSKVFGASVTTLNSEKDRASTLIVMEVTETGQGKPASKLRYTWAVDVVKKDDVWKADQVQVVADPVVLGSGAQQNAAPSTTTAAPQPTTQTPGN
ncbi:hypothetical protein AB0N05_03780 [Nocardia sp. NPDC051030]|uniref:hypothetical protein n=1 Tax=Nocardia sp. NPDC051030 TaxID=3155162 RepID=UPI003419C53F